MSVSPASSRIFTDGGVNDRSKFPRWLDDNVFGGATYASLFARKRPLVWIAASDIYSRVPFVFEPVTFNVLCSDLGKVRLSEAVAASAAVPGVFIPMNVENFGGACGGHVPQFMQRAVSSDTSPATLQASGAALMRYRADPARYRYVKLLDGGLTDNFGIHSLAIARSSRDRPYMPDDRRTRRAGQPLPLHGGGCGPRPRGRLAAHHRLRPAAWKSPASSPTSPSIPASTRATITSRRS